MRTPVLASVDPPPPLFEPGPATATRGAPGTHARRAAFRSSLLGIPLAAGLGWMLRSRRTGLVAGGATALALGALRWQMSRWFVDTPAYAVDARHGALELRSYPAQVEARTELTTRDLQTALDAGFGRLACYIFGANEADEDIAMTAPVVTTLDHGTYTMSFVMPPGRTRASLPEPYDARVELHERPARRVAVLRFSGRYTDENVGRHELALRARVTEVGLAARGKVAFAGYDAPATIPALRRNEVWLELA